MDDLISRQAAIEAIDQYYKNKKYIARSRTILSAICLDIKNTMNSLPSADRPQGEWILSDLQSQADNDNGNYTYVCTNCNHTDIHAKTQKVPYCWWCGARMKGADDE